MISMKNVLRRTTSRTRLLGDRISSQIRYALGLPPDHALSMSDHMLMNTEPRRMVILRATQKPFWRLW